MRQVTGQEVAAPPWTDVGPVHLHTHLTAPCSQTAVSSHKPLEDISSVACLGIAYSYSVWNTRQNPTG